MKEISQHAARALYEAAKDALHAMKTGNSEVSAINKLTVAIDLADREATAALLGAKEPVELCNGDAEPGLRWACGRCGEAYARKETAITCCLPPVRTGQGDNTKDWPSE